MTEVLYMPSIESNYIKDWDAKVEKRKDDYVVLDKSAFYPLGGGQPSDTGYLEWSGGRARVREVTKKGIIKHHIEGELPEGDVHAVLDWDRRYGHMRMHTAQHIVSGIVYDEFGARTVGNQLYAERSRIDFQPAHFTKEDLDRIAEMANQVIARNIDVTIQEEGRDSLEQRVSPERCNLDLIPQSVRKLRIVEIPGFDVCPCAGTHVRNTGELGKVKMIKRENKGKDRERIIYILE
ncbi:MAG: alanyl-tRNA editing protein [Thermoplasmata archaeon]|nr:alanyl-tRNA editing protein [Thermoplasmata archaeon]